jgi:prepilin-type N-terminal cleavage/methylation domain-containing protein
MVQRIRRLQNQRHEEGFTLIELLIVIVVLGILAGIVVLGLGAFRQDATTAACNADKKQVQTALDAFMASPGNATGDAPAVGDWASLTAPVPPATKPLLKSQPDTAVVWDATGDVTGPAC